MLQLHEKPLVEGESILALIPQRAPIVMVDKLLENDETTSVSGFTIKEENIFCENGYFTEPGIIENIAQTAALRAGYTFSLMPKDDANAKPPLGFIAAIKKLIIHQLPKVGSELLTEVVVQQIIFDVTLITAKSTVNGELVAECEMKIFLKKD